MVFVGFPHGSRGMRPSRTWESSERCKRRRRPAAPAVKRPPRRSFCTPRMSAALGERAEMDAAVAGPLFADGNLCGPAPDETCPPTDALLSADNHLTDIRGQTKIDAAHFANAS